MVIARLSLSGGPRKEALSLVLSLPRHRVRQRRGDVVQRHIVTSVRDVWPTNVCKPTRAAVRAGLRDARLRGRLTTSAGASEARNHLEPTSATLSLNARDAVAQRRGPRGQEFC